MYCQVNGRQNNEICLKAKFNLFDFWVRKISNSKLMQIEDYAGVVHPSISALATALMASMSENSSLSATSDSAVAPQYLPTLSFGGEAACFFGCFFGTSSPDDDDEPSSFSNFFANLVKSFLYQTHIHISGLYSHRTIFHVPFSSNLFYSLYNCLFSNRSTHLLCLRPVFEFNDTMIGRCET